LAVMRLAQPARLHGSSERGRTRGMFAVIQMENGRFPMGQSLAVIGLDLA
jgi:hypothetical protein